MDVNNEGGQLMFKYVLRPFSLAALFFSLATIIVALLVYSYLPETIPIHWNWEWEVDRTGSKSFIFVFALLPLAIYLLTSYIPHFEQKQTAFMKHKKAYSVFVLVIVIFLSILSVAMLLLIIGYPIDFSKVIGTELGIFLLIIGNYMRQIRPNGMFGIRTPWAKASEKNWRATHRLGSVLYAISGMWILVGLWIAANWWLFTGFALILIFSIVLVAYSYYLHQKNV
jgi:uncharacterized membrane protein